MVRQTLFVSVFFLVPLFSCAELDCAEEEGCKAAQTEQHSEIDDIVTDLIDENTLSGVVSVTIAGETVYERAFNNESLRETFEIETDTAFAIASLTKSFTAALTLDQVLSGNIELDAPVSAYLPDFDAAYADSVTVRQLLQNRSGIPHYVDVPGWFDPEAKAKFTPESFLAELSKLTLKFEPSTEYLYSNVNYYLLGLILDSTSGQRYESLLGDTILGPLGLTNTGQIYSDETGTLAPTFLREGDGYERIEITNPNLFRATGSQYSTTRDLALFADALMTGELLDAEAREVLFDPERPMGFSVTSDEIGGSTVEIVTYNGELVGTTTMLTMFPEKRMSIAILSNNNTPYPTLVEITLALARSIFTNTAHPAP